MPNFHNPLSYRGFTLIELLIVIAIIGILSSVVLVNLSSARTKALATKSVAQLQSVNTLLQGYYADRGSYPVSSAWQGYCSRWGASLGVNWIPELLTSGWTSGGLPIDPRNEGSCFDDSRQYIYRSDGVNYKLISHQPPSMAVPNNLIDPSRPTWAWGWWTPGAATW